MPIEDKNALKKKSKFLDPIVRIGKNGLTENMMTHIKRAVKKRQLVKVKFLRSFVDSNDVKKAAEDIAQQTGAEILELVGFNVVLYNPKIKRAIRS